MKREVRSDNFETQSSILQGSLRVDKVKTLMKNDFSNPLKEALKQEAGEEVCKYIGEHIDLRNTNTILFSSSHQYLYDLVDFKNVRAIVNLKKVNNVEDVNNFFTAVNKLLPDAGIYIGCVDTILNKKSQIYQKYSSPISPILWSTEFLIKQPFSKINALNRIQKFFTNTFTRSISLAETLGRLVFCGFDIIEYKVIGNSTYFVVMKTSEAQNEKAPVYGPIFAMNRIGKDGKIIKVYKMRTMYPYSEYIQKFVVKMNGYNEVGKPNDDFRITIAGKFLRKLWLDEIPQLVNLFKGELGIVGVRPLSKTRFNEFPKDMQMERIKYKPGCIPPYVSLNMPDSIGNIEAERIYLRDMSHDPYFTNLKYFLKAVYNIATNKIRSA